MAAALSRALSDADGGVTCATELINKPTPTAGGVAWFNVAVCLVPEVKPEWGEIADSHQARRAAGLPHNLVIRHPHVGASGRDRSDAAESQ
jgi:hypothetical protein